MHELAIAQEIVALACERARGARARRVVVAVGRLTAVLPDALQLCFEVCREGTALHDAELDIREVPGRARCRGCAAEMALDQPFGICACGSTDLEWLSGEELRLERLELC